MALELEVLTGAIIGAAIEVHRALGPGFLESVYEEALVLELEFPGIPFTRQVTIPIRYRDTEAGVHRLDLFVDDLIVVELKVVRELIPEHFAVVRSYLRAVGREHGLLLNFSRTTHEVKRVIAHAPSG